jgi:hypothetical protein
MCGSPLVGVRFLLEDCWGFVRIYDFLVMNFVCVCVCVCERERERERGERERLCVFSVGISCLQKSFINAHLYIVLCCLGCNAT